MAITRSFSGMHIKIPGAYGPGPDWYKRFALIQFLGKLGLKSCRPRSAIDHHGFHFTADAEL